MGVDDRIKKIFSDIQLNTNAAPVLVKSMKNVFNLMDNKKFKEDFIFCTKKFMMVLTRDSHIERGIDFISKFTASFANAGQSNKENNGESIGEEEEEEEDMHPFTMHFFLFLLSCQDAQSKSVRFRSCQLIQKLLSDLGAEALIEDDLYDKIYNEMLISVYDKCHAVRIHAALALTRLQDPGNPQCLVLEAYVKLLTTDSNPEVRKAVLVSIAACSSTVSSILEKTLDVNASIRKLAFKVISEKIHIKALTIVQRVTLIRRGVNDRSEAVTAACMNLMVKVWMSKYNDDMITLLSSLYCQNYQQECQQFLQLWFKKNDPDELVGNFKFLDERICIPVAELTPENAFYWRMLCQYIILHPSPHIQTLMDKVLPTCLNYVTYLKELVKGLECEDTINTTTTTTTTTTTVNEEVDKSFKLLQVVSLMTYLDVSDETGRRAVLDVIRSMLLSMATPSDQVLPCLVEQFLKLHESSDKEVIITKISAILTDIMRPDFRDEVIIQDAAQRREIEMKIASNTVQLIYQQDLLTESVEKQLFEEAISIKQTLQQLNQEKNKLTTELNELTFGKGDEDDVTNTQIKNDPETMIRCLKIVSKMLSNKRFDKLTPTIHSIIEELILPGITCKDTGVREVAVECLGLCCVRELQKGRQYIPLFIQVILVDVDEVKVSAIKAIFNLLLIFGLPVVQTNNMKSNPQHPLPAYLLDEDSKSATEDNNEEEEEEEEEEGDIWNKILNILTEFLDTDSVLRTVSYEGLCKLLMVNRIDSPGLLSRLFLLWYNPLTEDDSKLRQFLSFFFVSYAQKSRANQEIISETYLPTIKFLLHAPPSSPLSSIKVENVAELLIHLSDSEKLANFINHGVNVSKQKESDCGSRPHDELAILLCNELLKDSSDRTPNEVKVYTRTLHMLNISMENRDTLQSLRGLLKKIFKTRAVSDRAALRSLLKVSKEVKLALQKFIEPGLDLSQLELNDSKEFVISSGTTTTQASDSVMDVTMQYDKSGVDNDDAGNDDAGGADNDDAGGGADNDDAGGADNDVAGGADNDDKGDDGDVSLNATLKADVSKRSSSRFNAAVTNDNENNGDDEEEDDDEDDFELLSTSVHKSVKVRNAVKKVEKNSTCDISRRSLKRKHYTTYEEEDDDEEDEDEEDDDDIVESDSDDDFE